MTIIFGLVTLAVLGLLGIIGYYVVEYFRGKQMSEKSDKILEELGYKPAKTKITQPKKPYEAQGRDLFQTPNYAVDLLVPFIPKYITHIWECAAGQGKIVDRLRHHGYYVWATDISKDSKVHQMVNFLTGLPSEQPQCIVTNPPFSIKIEFYNKCREYNVPFALLIPADYAIWNIEACWWDGAEKIIPHRRIDYITPSGKSGATGHTSDFHSLWLTWGFGLGKTETFVELTNEEKKGNI